MKSALLVVMAAIFAVLPTASAAPLGRYQHGTVIRMRMGDCALMRGGFMAAFGPPQAAANEGSCPEYTLLSDKVVFVIVSKSSKQLVPLAEVVDFRFDKKELAVRVDDARHESKFAIREMTLRSEWEMIQRHLEDELEDSPHRGMDTSMALRNRN